jgi:hypothetical protein
MNDRADLSMSENAVPGHKARRLPVMALSAEYLTIGHLMRRNILAYKAPPFNEGYDIICIHPDPRRKFTKQIRIQVKSRYQTDSNRAVPIKAKSLDAFDYLIVAFLNIGYFSRKPPKHKTANEPEFYTLPTAIVREHHKKVRSGFDYIWIDSIDLDPYKNERGFELIAAELEIPFPCRLSEED